MKLYRILLLLFGINEASYALAQDINIEEMVSSSNQRAGNFAKNEASGKHIPHYSKENAENFANKLASKSEADLKAESDKQIAADKLGKGSVGSEIALKTAERTPLDNMDAHEMFARAKKIYEDPLATLNKITEESCKAMLNAPKDQYTKTTIVEKKKDIEYEEQSCEKPNKAILCEKTLTVTCEAREGECDAGGIVQDSMLSGMTFSYSHPHLYIRTPYWEPTICSESTKVTNFKINGLQNIKKFTLTRVMFDDHLLIKVNGTQVYIGPESGDRLEVTRRTRYGTITTDGKNRKACERSTNWDFYPNENLLHLLREGDNEISITLITAGHGNAQVWIDARQYCCSKFKDNWSKRCF